MRSFLWQSILLGFAATSTAIYQGGNTTDPDAVGVVRVQRTNDWTDFGSGVVLGNGKCVITAAHVVHGLEAGNLKVFKNKMEQGKITRTETSVAGSSIHIHPMYKGLFAYDFAVVELASVMDASPWKVSVTRGGALDLTMYGWGSISIGSTFPNVLRSAVNKNSAISGSECKRWDKIVGAICVMSSKSNSAEGLNCPGDSGGPNVANNYVVGVSSGKNGDCGFQKSGLLAGLSGWNQEDFMRNYESTCGFKFGNPLEAECHVGSHMQA